MPAEPFLRRRRQEAGRDDLIGVDVLEGQHGRLRADREDRLHRFALLVRLQPSSSRGSATTPFSAAAAAVIGLARIVRAPAPWRPSKLRLLVLTESFPGGTMSPFMPRHIEQPGSRHSPPAARMI